MSRDDGGLYGSWSWSESNFHKNDTVDSSYTDPNHRPGYSISGFTTQQIELATTLCSSRGLDGNLLDGCIYDVVITNDTTFAEQETLKTGCPRQCSGKGRCVDGTCDCLETWSGHDCSIGECGVCYNGDCESGFCKCSVGWDGVDCSEEATCYEVNNCTDSDHGVCDKMERCLCRDGYTGENCSLTATCYNRKNCSQNGVCVDFDACRCNLGYKGLNCDQFSCEVQDYCSKKGRCIAKDVCLCNPGWTGPSCAQPDCSDLSYCSENGICQAPNVCLCNTGYTGRNCSQHVLCPDLENCNHNGLCVKNENITENEMQDKWTCRCLDGFLGEYCETALCDSVNNCSSHGHCVEPNVCQCDNGYTGDYCLQYSCETYERCSGHGECVDYDVCSCTDGWSGAACDIPDCSEENDCYGQGLCHSPHNCECFDGFQGISCNETLGENIYTPMFNESLYEVTILENAKGGTFIAKVTASDEDGGRNGLIRYSVDPSGLSININSYLMVQSFTGDVILVKPLSRTLVPDGIINITLVARDGGSPSLSSEAILVLYIKDINDHCPVFTSPRPGEVINLNESYNRNDSLFRVTAMDEDFDDNGNVTYKLSNDVDSSFFRIDPVSGLVYSTVEYLSVGEYRVTFTATDQSLSPCGVELSTRIQVVPTPTEATSETRHKMTTGINPNGTSTEDVTESTNLNSSTETKQTDSPTD